MASEVDIANLALANLGEAANVSSLDPPEGSVEAELCARFYRIARDELLAMHAWSFASRRVALAQLEQSIDQWAYQYAAPADMMSATAVLDPEAGDDYEVAGAKVPQDYAIESNADGDILICTNLEDAVLRYQAKVTDTSRFPPLFVTSLSWMLASKLAGPIIKGGAGREEAKNCYAIAARYIMQAQGADAAQRQIDIAHVPVHLAGR